MKQTISIVLPAFNEAAIIEESLAKIHEYLQTIAQKYISELVVVNDGSSDNTGELAENFAKKHANVKVIHHNTNKNLGSAIVTGFTNSKSDYIVVYDLDMSYSPDHIKKLIDTIIDKKADIVIASPYMKGGKVTNVPKIRKYMSRFFNRYLSMTSRKKVYTFSGMVRAYRRDFVTNLDLKATNYAINSEIIFKAQILRANIVEIPAHLDWSHQNKYKVRSSGIRVKEGVLDGLVTGFMFRPYMFFFLVSAFLFLIFFYIAIWFFINLKRIMSTIIIEQNYFDDLFSESIAVLFQQRPHTFIIGGFLFLIALQFFGIGFISLQKKRYFDELFHLNTSILRRLNKKQ